MVNKIHHKFKVEITDFKTARVKTILMRVRVKVTMIKT